MQTTTTTTVTAIPDERRWQGRDWAKLGITGLLALALLRPGVSAQPEAGVPAVAATPVPVVVSTPVPTLAALAAPAIFSTREAVFAGPYTVRGTGTPGSTVEVLVNGAPVGTAVVGPDGNWRLDTTLAAGEAELVARAVDAGGQVVATGEAVKLAVGEALAAPTFDAPAGAVESGPITLSGTGTPARGCVSGRATRTWARPWSAPMGAGSWRPSSAPASSRSSSRRWMPAVTRWPQAHRSK